MATWKEVKKEIDRQLEERGISQDEDIFWLDTHMPHKPEDIEVGFDPEMGITVSS